MNLNATEWILIICAVMGAIAGAALAVIAFLYL